MDRPPLRFVSPRWTGVCLGLLLVGLIAAACGSASVSTNADTNSGASTSTSTEPDVTSTSGETEATSDSAEAIAASTSTEPSIPRAGLSGSDLSLEGKRSLWTGTIGADIGISLWVAQHDDFLRGEITYDSVGEPIQLLGRRYEQANGYFLHEFSAEGRVSGTMILGNVSDGIVTEATWGDLPLELTLDEISEQPYFFDPLVRPGRYEYHFAPFGGNDECCGASGVLTIGVVTDESASISFENVTGGPGFNLAFVEETTVPLQDNRASFISAEKGLDCAFDVVVFDGFAFVDYVDDRFDCGFGNAAGVSGMYVLTQQYPSPEESSFFGQTLTFESLGPVSLGDTWADLTERFGVRPHDPAIDDEVSEGCNYLLVPGDPFGPWLMLLGEGDQSVVSRIELAHRSQRTEAGIGIGSTEAEVIAAYPDAIDSQLHPYEGGDAKYLRVTAADGSRDVTTLLFETDGDGIVRQLRAGYADPIRWIEGCA